MKSKFLLLGALCIIMLGFSCAPTNFYQVYETQLANNLKLNDNSILYEDENCQISYNLWAENGNIGFNFYNKLDVDIYIHLDKSFFILNGMAHDYFKNRTFTNTTNSSYGSSSTSIYYFTPYLNLDIASKQVKTATRGYSTSYYEKKIVCIPAKTSKTIREYNINTALYRNCDLYKYPVKRKIKTLDFNKKNSPFIFSNRISYKLDKSENLIKVENSFYVSKITNYPEREMMELRYEEYCGQKSTSMKKFIKNVGPNKFYIKYNRINDSWRH